jgi:hypothetical protein
MPSVTGIVTRSGGIVTAPVPLPPHIVTSVTPSSP